MLNKAQLIGNLGKDPETLTTQSGTNVTKFSIATTEYWKDKNGEKKTETIWHNIVCWRSYSDIASKYLKKGSKVYLEGKIVNRSYESDGTTKYITEIVVSKIVLLDKKETTTNPAKDAPLPEEPENNMDDTDLPF